MKSVKSLREYRVLNKLIKQNYPKYELALWFNPTSELIRLVAVPKYTGFNQQCDTSKIKDTIYAFGQFHAFNYNNVKKNRTILVFDWSQIWII